MCVRVDAFMCALDGGGVAERGSMCACVWIGVCVCSGGGWHVPPPNTSLPPTAQHPTHTNANTITTITEDRINVSQGSQRQAPSHHHHPSPIITGAP